MRDDTIYLAHIQESIDRVRQYTAEGERVFYDDVRTRDAVLRRMETLADAASHLSSGLREKYPGIPWRQIADFRNVLAHGYVDIRLERVWDAVVNDLPALAELTERELGTT